MYVVWEITATHENEKIDPMLWAAAGRLALLYLPTYSPWLNSIEMLWRHFRLKFTHGGLFDAVEICSPS
jgi:transposase